MGNTIRSIIAIVAFVIIIVAVGAFLTHISFQTITEDRAFKGVREDGGAITDRDDPVAKFLAELHLARREDAMNTARTIGNDKSLPPGITSYFEDFEEYLGIPKLLELLKELRELELLINSIEEVLKQNDEHTLDMIIRYL